MKLLFRSTYLRVQLRLLSHATHAQRRARQLDRPTHKVKRRNQTRAKPPDARRPTLGSACVTVRAGWLLTVGHFKQAKTAGKLPLPLLLLRWLDGRGLCICLAASHDPDRSLSRNYSLTLKKKEKKNSWNKCDILKSPEIDGLSGITLKKEKEMKTTQLTKKVPHRAGITVNKCGF